LGLVVRQAQDSVGLTRMSFPNTVGLSSQPSSRHLGLAVCQAHDRVGLTRMSNSGHLNLAVNQVQENYHPPLACPRE